MELSVTTFKASCKCHAFVISKNFKKENKIFIETFLLVRRTYSSFQHTGLQSYKLLPYNFDTLLCNGLTQRPGTAGRLCLHGSVEPRRNSASGPRNPPASSSPLCPVHVFLASWGGSWKWPKSSKFPGGCGGMYKIQIMSEEFKEKRTV